ncbi:EAL domain-containing protein [Neorhizobium sp. S3-V5DH]|uniref:putative bifunctional diguanylate cyclase/phosphodiesterase n=1 Tax=Neorhizobium sp. S3-V5DH TaxID=2485166 RepID=UPI00104C63D7|nr:EAL domain-containing protein [Neorhizobium sp. S3-V5DH]TCV76319.1 diguanylate cyclase (GGDEF)-like protein [Neorhizobium sp. S3-V5DH]
MVIAIAIIIDGRHTESYRTELRGTTERTAALLAQRFSSQAETDILAADHLVHVLQEDAQGSIERFQHYIDNAFKKGRHFFAVAVAPNFELTQVITRDGIVNGASGKIGSVDLSRLASSLKSVDGRGRLSFLSGTQDDHLTLVMPVPKSEDGGGLWGAIAILIEERGFIEASGVTFSPNPIARTNLLNLDWLNVVLRDADRPEYFAFYGDDSIEGQSPMEWAIPLKGANWTMLASPHSGWDITPPNQSRFRLGIALAVGMVIVPIFIAASLISERNRHIAILKARELNLTELSQRLRSAKENTDIKNAELELALDELSNREQELEELSTRFDLALASYNCGIWESDPVTQTEIWDARMCQLHSIPYTDGIIHRDQWINLLHPDDRERAKQESHHLSEGLQPPPLVARVLQPDGSSRYIRSIGKLHVTRDGARKMVGIAFDVTQDAILTQQLKAAKDEADAKNAELELAKSRIEHNSLHDPLTLLANRRKLDMELDRLSRASQTERQKFSLLHLDLDRFKQINDTLGHAAGDAMLVHASRVLSRNVRGTDIVARIGGDEFVILAVDNASAEEMAQLAQRIIVEFHQPIDFEGFSCRCGVSIGIAQANGMNVDARRTLVNADLALYRAKGLGRNRYEFFTQNLQAEIVSHKRTADEVLAGIDNDEFTSWYQPQFDAQTNELVGVEALIRWNHPHHGVLAPDKFLKIAEDLNVSATLDQIVLETAMRDKLRWIARGLKIPKVSVNVSSKRLHDERLIDRLKPLEIIPGEISFELVESIFLDESEDVVIDNLKRIKELGIDIEIDDFGTGHTSIVSLLKLKPKRLKIDRQLVMPILDSPQERALVRSIIDIARSLGVETVAEGIETMQHAALLRELGCDLLQGYAFSRPLSFNDFTQAALTNWRKAAA